MMLDAILWLTKQFNILMIYTGCTNSNFYLLQLTIKFKAVEFVVSSFAKQVF